MPPNVDITEPTQIVFLDINETTGLVENKTLVQIPIYSILRDPSELDAPKNNLTFYLGVTFKNNNTVVIDTVPSSDYKYYIYFGAAVLCTVGIAIGFVYMSSHASIAGLRYLNAKLTELFSADTLEDLQVRDSQRTCEEIDSLITLFQGLISTKKFTNNEFLNMSDTLAVIELAESCQMFERETQINYKATGVCYNNIANYFVKNGKYKLAAQNFEKALDQITKLKGAQSIENQKKSQYQKVWANRRYQLAITHYKWQKYTNHDLDDQGQKAFFDRWKYVDTLCHQSIEEY